MKVLSKFLVLTLLLLAKTAFGAEFTILTEELPPFNYTENGKVTGFSSEIVLELCDRIGHPRVIKVVPWARGYRSILEEENYVLFSMTRTPQRETLFKWVGPIYEPTIVFFAKAGSTLAIHSMDDAKKVGKIGTYLKDAEETLLKEAGFENLVSVGDDFLNPRKLIRGRIDLWITGDLEGVYKARKAKVDPDDIEIVYTIKKKQYYIAFSKNTPDTEVRKWQAALDAMREDGSYERLLAKYL